MEPRSAEGDRLGADLVRIESKMAADFGHGGIGVLVTPGGVTGMRPATLDAEIAGVALVRAMRDAAAMDQQVHVRVVAGNVEDRRVTRLDRKSTRLNSSH